MAEEYTSSHESLALPKESRMMYVLDGAGNGLTAAGIPTLIYEIIHSGGVGRMSKYDNKLLFAVPAVGAVIGAVWGWNQAERIHDYRAAVRNEMQQQRHKIEELTHQQRALQARLDAKEVAPVR